MDNVITNRLNRAIDGGDDGENINDRRAFQNAELFANDAGGYAHNRVYVKRLAFDSIDWLEDGSIDGSIDDYSGTYSAGAAWLGTSRP